MKKRVIVIVSVEQGGKVSSLGANQQQKHKRAGVKYKDKIIALHSQAKATKAAQEKAATSADQHH